MSFVLANRLQNPTLLATQLMDIFCDVMMHDRSIQHSIRLDLQVKFIKDLRIESVVDIIKLWYWSKSWCIRTQTLVYFTNLKPLSQLSLAGL